MRQEGSKEVGEMMRTREAEDADTALAVGNWECHQGGCVFLYMLPEFLTPKDPTIDWSTCHKLLTLSFLCVA